MGNQETTGIAFFLLCLCWIQAEQHPLFFCYSTVPYGSSPLPTGTLLASYVIFGGPCCPPAPTARRVRARSQRGA